MSGVVATVGPRLRELRTRRDRTLTELADHLVRAHGVPFRMAHTIAARLQQARGARPDAPVVSYCMIGMRASVVYFVMRHLGVDARLYDGSIVDWGRRGLPTVRTGGPR